MEKHAQPSLNKMRVETKVYEEELKNGLLFLDRARRNKVRILKEIEEELSYQSELKDKLVSLKKQFKLFQVTNQANRNSLNDEKEKSLALKNEVERVESIVRNFENKNIKSVVNNNFPLLIQKVNEGKGFPKEKSILLNCIKELINNTYANEFSGFDWKAKVGQTENGIGTRIQFSNLFIMQNDLSELYGPVIANIGKTFGKSNISIQTKTKKENGVVKVMDITIKIPYKIKERNLELP